MDAADAGRNSGTAWIWGLVRERSRGFLSILFVVARCLFGCWGALLLCAAQGLPVDGDLHIRVDGSGCLSFVLCGGGGCGFGSEWDTKPPPIQRVALFSVMCTWRGVRMLGRGKAHGFRVDGAAAVMFDVGSTMGTGVS